MSELTKEGFFKVCFVTNEKLLAVDPKLVGLKLGKVERVETKIKLTFSKRY